MLRRSASVLLRHARFISTSFQNSQSVTIISAPVSAGQRRPGTEMGPKTLYDAGLMSHFEKKLWHVRNVRNAVPPDSAAAALSNADRQELAGKHAEAIYRTVKEAAKDPDEFVLTVGGDHSISAGTILGILSARPDTCVIWIDAHADINTFQTSPSGNLHGMSAALSLGLDPAAVNRPGLKWLADIPKTLAAERLVYVGLRDLDEGEAKLLRERGIAHFTTADIDRDGMHAVIARALDTVDPHSVHPLHLSFDIDALDPPLCPSTGTPVIGGLTMREGLYACEYIYHSGRLRSMDLVEVNGLLGDDRDVQTTALSALAMIRAATGDERTATKTFPTNSHVGSSTDWTS